MDSSSKKTDDLDTVGQATKRQKPNDEEHSEMRKLPLTFKILGKYKRARASILTLPHGEVHTPIYMPVGTKASLKGLTSEELANIGYRLMLSNTYHLGTNPGSKIVDELGGIHKFMNWPYNVLTDSGGFQMVSLSKLCEITEKGVKFDSPYDSSTIFMRPEDSINIQNEIGADIIMALDDVVKTTTQGPRVEEACHRTIRWIDRCFEAHRHPERQNLFPIIQGAVDLRLRQICLDGLIAKNANGYAIGGLAGGESKEDFAKVVEYCTARLPDPKPRYLMGVGYPLDLVVCSSLGVDMFDCVYPTRTARFGVAFTRYGEIKLKKAEYHKDFTPIEEDCTCTTCKQFTKSYLSSIVTKEEVACHLVTVHNLHYLFHLMRGIHNAIIAQNLDEYVNNFLRDYYRDEKVIPDWVVDALKKAELNITVYNGAGGSTDNKDHKTEDNKAE